ncbi:hypothetical protein OHA72_39695 [Dactylosporangium sp. NBC_01737]|uniref:hypothetical protein n=1 Tax=Dactylosporangium sp. NBC_01737 TaxID=2975959 RepID=UPI002E120B8C|nr:hypothetical protein OHA72_39695 [Dactylosporangium sp. NBC_01737]
MRISAHAAEQATHSCPHRTAVRHAVSRCGTAACAPVTRLWTRPSEADASARTQSSPVAAASRVPRSAAAAARSGSAPARTAKCAA